VIRVGSDVPEQFKNDLNLETRGVHAYNNLIDLCCQLKDHGTREIIEPILADSEEHVDWVETQISLTEALGLQKYLLLQTEAETGGNH